MFLVIHVQAKNIFISWMCEALNEPGYKRNPRTSPKRTEKGQKKKLRKHDPRNTRDSESHSALKNRRYLFAKTRQCAQNRGHDKVHARQNMPLKKKNGEGGREGQMADGRPKEKISELSGCDTKLVCVLLSVERNDLNLPEIYNCGGCNREAREIVNWS